MCESSLDIYSYSLRMRTELRCIHTLDAGDAIAEITGMGGEEFIFEYISALPQVTEEEISTRILSAFIIAQTALPFITAQHIHRFQGGSP